MGQRENADETACEDIADCTAPLTANAQNECHCPPDTHFGDVASCVRHIDCEGDNEVRNAEDNTCRCADNFDGGLGNCTACTGGKTSAAGADCACPADTLPFENSAGVCEAMRTCTDPRNTYNSETNMCECPSGQRLNAEESGCEAIPSSGDGDDSSGGSAAVLVAVPVLLFGAYWLIDGVDKVEPAYNFSYSGVNENFHYTGNAGFNLRHGGLRSYVSAIQSSGNAVSYESGISYEKDYFFLTYDAAESESEYLYDLEASMKAEFGLWTIFPTAAAEFQYRPGEEGGTSEASAGVSATWSAHRWTVRAQSAFAGGDGHALDLSVVF